MPEPDDPIAALEKEFLQSREAAFTTGHPGNRVWIADCGDDWSILIAAHDYKAARRMAWRACSCLSGASEWEVLQDLRLHRWIRPDGSEVKTDAQGWAEDDKDYAYLGFDSDAFETWFIADRAKEPVDTD